MPDPKCDMCGGTGLVGPDGSACPCAKMAGGKSGVRHQVDLTNFKKDKMEWFYSQQDNPWEYDMRHFAAYKAMFNDIKPFLNDLGLVLEIGCGEGYFAKQFLSEFSPLAYCGFEISKTAAERAAVMLKHPSRLPDMGLGVIQMDVEKEKEKLVEWVTDASLVICVECLYYFSDPPAFQRFLTEHMPKGSMLLVADSIRMYIQREYAVRKLGFQKLTKSQHKLVHDGTAWRSLTAILSQAP